MLAAWVALFAAGASAAIDARTGRIPNWLTLPLVPLGVALQALDSGSRGLLAAGLGALLCFLVPFVMFWSTRGAAIGGGDVKLFAGLGALLGPGIGLEVELGAFVALTVLALFVLTWRGLLWRTLKNSFWLFANRFLPKEKRRTLQLQAMTSLRMGPAIFISCGISHFLLR